MKDDLSMEDYLFECPNPAAEELARAMADLFAGQTRFTGRITHEHALLLSANWVAMRMQPDARRITMTFAIAPAAFARYRALPAQQRARSCAVLRAYAEAALGSLEQQHMQGENVGHSIVIGLGDEFA